MCCRLYLHPGVCGNTFNLLSTVISHLLTVNNKSIIVVESYSQISFMLKFIIVKIKGNLYQYFAISNILKIYIYSVNTFLL